MNQIRFSFPVAPAVLFAALLTLFSFAPRAHASVFLVTDTMSLDGETAIIRGSSELPGDKTDPTSNVLLHMFDTDSTTCWFEGSQTSGQGQWIEIRYPDKKKIKGMIFGAGCRQDYICLGDNSVPSKITVRLDEKPTFDYTFDWDAMEGPPSTLTNEEVNMRKSFLWFDSDTAFSSTVFQIKFQDVRKGARYDKLAMSDFAFIDPSDTRFQLMDILSKLTVDPNDLGTINSPALLIGNDDPARVKEFVDSVYGQESSDDWKQDSSKVEQGINAGMHAISDGNQIAQLIPVLKKLLIKDGNMIRYRLEGRLTTYMLQDGTLFLGGKQWDIWRYFSTIQTSKGIELTIRYVPFAN